jgi:hypothetical protein
LEWGDTDSHADAVPHADAHPQPDADSHTNANPVSYCVADAFGADPDAHSGSVHN